ncbi:MAG: peptidylprolyl isomerase [Verrucomicrobiaceae bacterium]|nr:peptidylprolyl isomerase [Verrucomicrobiaceae bacterium]
MSTDADLYRVSWTDNATAEDYYAIFASTTADMGTNPVAYADPNSTSVEFTLGTQNMANGTTWYFWVRPTKVGPIYGGSESGFVSLPATSFNAPTGLSVTNTANTNVATLTFTDNSTQEAFYEVWARDVTAGGSLIQLVNIPFSSSPASVFYYLQPGRTYELQLRAARYSGAYGNSALAYTGFSNPATVTMSGTYDATPPPAPTNLSVASVLSSPNYYFGVHFDDTSTNETGFEVQYKGAGAADTSFVTADIWTVDNTTSTTTNLGIGDYLNTGTTANVSLDFRVRALRGNGPFAIASAYSSTIGATTATFNAPANLRVTAPADNGKVQMFWSDNATTETGYQIEFRYGTSGTFTSLGTLNSTAYSRYQNSGGIGGFPPSSTIQFQIKAVNATTSTAYSNIATVVTPPLTAPTNLAHTTPQLEQVVLTWTDNSGNEGNYEVQYQLPGATTFSNYDYLAAGTTTVTINGVPPGSQFRVRATYGSGPDYFSDFSNIITANPALKPPTALTVTAASDRQLNLSWTDNSGAEAGYAIYCKASTDSQFQFCGSVDENLTTFSARFVDSGSNTPFTPNTTYQFEVYAFFGSSLSTAATGSATTKDGATSDLSPPMFVNEAFTYTFTATTSQGTISSTSLTGTLPPGITYDSVTRVLSGTPTARGAFTPTLSVTWSNGWSTTYTLHLRPIYRPARPQVVTPIADHTLTLGGAGASLTIPLQFTFADPDSESAVAIGLPGPDGTPGARSMTIILNDSVTPGTVANFRSYLNNASDGYTASVFHRLVQGFILQGGANRSSPLPGAASNALAHVTKNSPIQNEPGVPNLAGTIAMAKLPGNPHSATTDFFFNLADNTANLDFQNEGFSVFGRVAQPSLATLSALASLPLPPAAASGQPANYQVLVDAVAIYSTTASGSTTVVPSSFESISKGQLITGSGIPANTFVTAVNGTTNITISNPATASGTSSLKYGLPTVVVNSTMTSGSTTIVPASFASIVAGLGVSGAGIPANTTVTAVNGTTNITISNPATASATSPLTYGIPSAFSSMPYNAGTAPAPPIDASKLLRIDSVVSSVPVLNGYTVSGNTNSSAVSATISGTDLTLNGLTGGASTISLQVSDLDGNQLLTPLSFNVTVMNTLGAWATAEGLPSGQDGPDADPDNDGRKNLLEYALMSSPGTSNGSSDPVVSSTTDGADKKASITFKVRKFATLTYTVEGSSNLTSWSTVWTSTDGFGAANVASAANNADHTLVTIKDNVPYTDATPRFLRLKVTSP